MQPVAGLVSAMAAPAIEFADDKAGLMTSAAVFGMYPNLALREQ